MIGVIVASCATQSHPLTIAAMRFAAPLLQGHLKKRYKRFLADVELLSGKTVTAHCANPGAMLGLAEPGSRVWLSKSDNPKRKLKFSWELIEVDIGQGPVLVGINTARPNALVAAAINDNQIPEFSGYDDLRREVRYGTNSRIDILLEGLNKPHCYVEVKNMHLMRTPGLAEFPDSVTVRGAKHMQELARIAESGQRAVVFFLIQRSDAEKFAIARDIDPKYNAAFEVARSAGVEIISYGCTLSDAHIALSHRIPLAE